MFCKFFARYVEDNDFLCTANKKCKFSLMFLFSSHRIMHTKKNSNLIYFLFLLVMKGSEMLETINEIEKTKILKKKVSTLLFASFYRTEIILRNFLKFTDFIEKGAVNLEGLFFLIRFVDFFPKCYLGATNFLRLD